MKKLVLYPKFIWLFLLIGTSACAQWQNDLWVGKQAYNWYFGNRAGLNFNSTPPAPLFDSPLNSPEGSGSISDAQGNLLFYTNGTVIYNKNHEVMVNGDGLLGSTSASQSGLIIPAPGNPDIYYVFYQLEAAVIGLETGAFYYSEVDMSLADGLGAVTANKNILLATTPSEKITAVHHADKEQVWVVRLSGYPIPQISSFLISNGGVATEPVISNVGEVLTLAYGQLKASPDGSKLAAVNSPIAIRSLQVFDFNNSTGEVTNPVSLTSAIGMWSYGLEFSPNSQYLYAADMGAFVQPKLHQFDLKAGSQADILASNITVATRPDVVDFFSALQLAPDGKIYMSNIEKNFVSVINYPNNKGIAASFEYNNIILNNENTQHNWQRADLGLPGFIQSYFESGILYEGGHCQNEGIAFSTLRIPGIDSIEWDFGDPNSGADNASTDLEPVHAFSGPGTYTVTAVITSNGAEQTATTEVVINAVPDAVIPASANITLCAESTGTATFNLTSLNSEILNGQDPALFTVAFYNSEAAIETNNPITTPGNFNTSGQTIYAVVTDNVTGCTTVIAFELTVSAMPVADNPGEVFACSSYQLPALSEGNSYRTSPGGTGEELPVGHTITENTTLYIWAHSPDNPACVAENVFNITIETFDFDFKAGCDGNVYWLEVLPTDDSFNTNTAAYSWSGSGFSSSERKFEVPAPGVYTVTVTTASGCTEEKSFEVETTTCTIPRGISPNGDGLNDTFDLSGYGVRKLSVFNRYGMEVYSRGNYVNEWAGQSANNNELPTGTYYYVIERENGESKTGWVYVNRSE